jgi:hypothetical protein
MHDIGVSSNKVPHLLSTSNVTTSCLDMMVHENKENHKCKGETTSFIHEFNKFLDKTYSNKWSLVLN